MLVINASMKTLDSSGKNISCNRFVLNALWKSFATDTSFFTQEPLGRNGYWLLFNILLSCNGLNSKLNMIFLKFHHH